MRIIAFNGSPRGASGNTDVLVQTFLAGAREAGAETDTIYLKDHRIEHCRGCFSCWGETPGDCVHNDAMGELLQRQRSADIVIHAFPLYGNMVPGLMKDFMDRTLPLGHPAIEKQGDQYLHPARYDDGIQRFVVITNAGFPQTHHFEGLRKTYELCASGPTVDLLGMLCCAAGPMLTASGMQEKTRWYLDATFAAGREVVTTGRIGEETSATLDRSLADSPAEYADRINAYWRSEGVEMPDEQTAHHGPAEASEQIGSVQELVWSMPSRFSPEAAGELTAVLQFIVEDEDPGAYYLSIDNGLCHAFVGEHTSPTLTIRTPCDVWLRIFRNELDGATAFMEGQYKVEGDMSLLMRIGLLFSASP